MVTTQAQFGMSPLQKHVPPATQRIFEINRQARQDMNKEEEGKRQVAREDIHKESKAEGDVQTLRGWKRLLVGRYGVAPSCRANAVAVAARIIVSDNAPARRNRRPRVVMPRLQTSVKMIRSVKQR